MRTTRALLAVLLAIGSLAACGNGHRAATSGETEEDEAHEVHFDDGPLPAGCQLDDAIIAETAGHLVVHLDDAGVHLPEGSVAGEIVDVHADNGSSRAHELRFVAADGRVAGRIGFASGPLDCTARFDLRPGRYRLTSDAGDAPLEVTAGRPHA
jgi:hypothetical protein